MKSCKITTSAAAAHRKLLKIWLSKKYNHLFPVLLQKFKAARSKGHTSVDLNLLFSKARVIIRYYIIPKLAFCLKTALQTMFSL